MKFLEKDIICIDFEGVNDFDQFSKLSEKIKKSGIYIPETTWKMKTDLNISKLFLSKKTLEIIFMETMIFNSPYIGLYPFFSDKLMKMNSVKVKKEMTVDSILERISKNGIKSLTKKEEKILNRFKK